MNRFILRAFTVLHPIAAVTYYVYKFSNLRTCVDYNPTIKIKGKRNPVDFEAVVNLHSTRANFLFSFNRGHYTYILTEIIAVTYKIIIYYIAHMYVQNSTLNYVVNFRRFLRQRATVNQFSKIVVNKR